MLSGRRPSRDCCDSRPGLCQLFVIGALAPASGGGNLCDQSRDSPTAVRLCAQRRTNKCQQVLPQSAAFTAGTKVEGSVPGRATWFTSMLTSTFIFYQVNEGRNHRERWTEFICG